MSCGESIVPTACGALS